MPAVLTQQHCPTRDYKIPSERTIPEFRCFLGSQMACSLFLWDCRSVHRDADSWSLKPRWRAPIQPEKATADGF